MIGSRYSIGKRLLVCFSQAVRQESILTVSIVCVQVQKRACDKHDLAFYPKFKQWCDDYFLIKVLYEFPCPYESFEAHVQNWMSTAVHTVTVWCWLNGRTYLWPCSTVVREEGLEEFSLMISMIGIQRCYLHSPQVLSYHNHNDVLICVRTFFSFLLFFPLTELTFAMACRVCKLCDSSIHSIDRETEGHAFFTRA